MWSCLLGQKQQQQKNTNNTPQTNPNNPHFSKGKQTILSVKYYYYYLMGRVCGELKAINFHPSLSELKSSIFSGCHHREAPNAANSLTFLGARLRSACAELPSAACFLNYTL